MTFSSLVDEIARATLEAIIRVEDAHILSCELGLIHTTLISCNGCTYEDASSDYSILKKQMLQYWYLILYKRGFAVATTTKQFKG